MSLRRTNPPAQPRLDDLVRLSVRQYHDLLRSRTLGPDDRVELLEGLLLRKMSKDALHILVTELARRLLEAHLPAGYHTRNEAPVTTADSEPEPDLSVVRGSLLDYQDRHPRPRDVVLMVEVANTSLERDRGIKQRIYARAGCPVYWIIDTAGRSIHVHTDPIRTGKQPRYRTLAVYQGSDAVPLLIDGQAVAVLPVASFFNPSPNPKRSQRK